MAQNAAGHLFPLPAQVESQVLLVLAAGDEVMQGSLLPQPVLEHPCTLHLFLGTAVPYATARCHLLSHHSKLGFPSRFQCRNQKEMILSLTSSSQQTAEGFSCSSPPLWPLALLAARNNSPCRLCRKSFLDNP